MSMSDILDRACKREGEDPAIVRLGHHAIEMWRAAEELGDPHLLAALRPLVEHVGRALARDVRGKACADDTLH
ncbi:hypothetical protein MKL09_15375 [Methylobacterium sp. J-048]|uniref:hypothetical protein n=1 Tax=Methylobacterium sp. J-048 TaxID=2836635 RepID=UPI001FB9A430|nr:hypothetical protein [Methylobacterium sp. J-048]MCJ2057935.1 hypothetical protein [Methylobacterium sp. J-048]